jgi:hypothetical protein
LLGDRLGPIGVSAVIHQIGPLAFGLRPGFRCGAFRRLLLRFRGDARFRRFEAGIQHAAHDPDKNAELDRNKICHFQIHFPHAPPGHTKDDGTKKVTPSVLRKIFFETFRHDNLKIWKAGGFLRLFPMVDA